MRILMLTALGMLAGCASAPPVSETKTAITASAPAVATEVAPATEDGKYQFKPPPGYKVKIDDWDVVYCRKVAIIGSRFPKEICMTEPELKEHLAAVETMKRDKDQISRICSQAAGCANP